MSEVITIESKAFKIILEKLNFLEKTIKGINSTKSRWITEEEAMLLTDLSRRRLYDKRKNKIFNSTSATGRKVKYLRKDIEKYLEDNSTL